VQGAHSIKVTTSDRRKGYGYNRELRSSNGLKVLKSLFVSKRTEMPWCRVLEFTDPEACQAAVKGSDVKLLPTKRGSFHAEITQIGMNKLWMQRFKVALPQISTVEVTSKRKHIGFLLETSHSSLHHCGLEVSRNDIIVGGLDELHQRSEERFHYGTMSLPVGELFALHRTIVGRDLLDKPQIKMARPNLELMSRLRKLHDVIGQLANAARIFSRILKWFELWNSNCFMS